MRWDNGPPRGGQTLRRLQNPETLQFTANKTKQTPGTKSLHKSSTASRERLARCLPRLTYLPTPPGSGEFDRYGEARMAATCRQTDSKKTAVSWRSLKPSVSQITREFMAATKEIESLNPKYFSRLG